MVLSETTNQRPFRVFLRGNPRQRGELVAARFLSALGGTDQQSFLSGKTTVGVGAIDRRSGKPPHAPRRRELGLAASFWRRARADAGRFRHTRRPATHPQLLDFLATKVLEDEWSLKKLHRRMLLSQVYQQASAERLDARIVDPHNKLLWRMPRKRLSLEAMRGCHAQRER